MRNFNKLVLLLYLETILYSDKRNYMDFLDSNFTGDYHLNSFYNFTVASGWLCFCYVLLCISLCVYCKFMCIACISTCTILKTYLK